MTSNRTWVLEDSPQYEILRNAALTGDIGQLASLLTPNIDLGAMYGNGSSGRSLLHLAASEGRVEAVRLLLERGTDVNILDVNPYGEVIPLVDAAAAADLDSLRLLVKARANISFKDAENASPLNLVLAGVGWKTKLEKKHSDCIRYFLDPGLDINNEESLLDTGGMTILRKAVQLDNIDLVAELIDLELVQRQHFSSIGERETTTVKVSGMPAILEKTEVVKILISHPTLSYGPADLDAALFLAAYKANVKLLEAVLKSGVDVNVIDTKGRTALILACESQNPFGSANAVKYLLERGANIFTTLDPTQSDRYYSTIHAAAKRSNPDVIRQLLLNGADVNARDESGNTTLIAVVSCFRHGTFTLPSDSDTRMTTLRLILDAGVQVNTRNAEGRTALHTLAAQYGDTSVPTERKPQILEATQLLITMGIDTSLIDHNGNVAADLSPKEGLFGEPSTSLNI